MRKIAYEVYNLITPLLEVNAGIQKDKTIAAKLINIPINDIQIYPFYSLQFEIYPFCRLQLVFETFGHST